MVHSVLLMSGHEFVGLNSFLFVALILVCLVLGGLIKRYNFHYLPESGGSMLFGLVCGGLLNLASDDERSILTFSPELVFFVILPPIILDAGYTLKRKDFFRNLGTITMLAVVGTIINNLAFGYLMFGFAKLGWIPLNSSSPLECLLFGAVISATDPVATLAMLGSKEVNADPLLYSLVFGESVLNDAVAIVLYKTFDNALPSTSDPDAKTTFSVWDLFKALLTFIGVSLGSLCVGIGIALACSFIFKRVDFSRMPIYEFTLVTLFAFLSYFMAETMYLSGIMAIFFCSVCLAHYNYYNISTNAQIATQEGFKSIAQICETFVFAYLGITAGLSISTSHLLWSFGMIILTIIACPIARAVNVFPICAIANTRRQGAQKITPAMQIPLWFAGLRGAVAFALALGFPGDNTKYVVSSTLMLILFSTIVNGGLTLPVLRWTGMSRGQHDDSESHQFELLPAGEHSRSRSSLSESKDGDDANGALGDADPAFAVPSDDVPPVQEYGNLVARFKKFDKTFMRRVFGGADEARGQSTGLIDDYGAPILVDDFVLIPAHAASDPEQVAVRVRAHTQGATSAVPLSVFAPISPTYPSHQVAAPRLPSPSAATNGDVNGRVQPSYVQDEDELKSIFKATSPSAAAQSSQSSAYRPPVYSPGADQQQQQQQQQSAADDASPTSHSAMMSSSDFSREQEDSSNAPQPL